MFKPGDIIDLDIGIHYLILNKASTSNLVRIKPYYDSKNHERITDMSDWEGCLSYFDRVEKVGELSQFEKALLCDSR